LRRALTNRRHARIRKLIEAHPIRKVAALFDLTVALAQPYQRGETEGVRETFIAIQSTIDAIERAIDHEEGLETEQELAEPRT
jgi:predicted RNase H-like nuclease